jgi:Raf kinase inhibitor-like YbhB/YbcL family protein
MQFSSSIFAALAALGLAACGGGQASCPSTASPAGSNTPAPAPDADLLDPNHAPPNLVVKLSAPDGHIPLDNVFNGFGCTGKNVSLGVSWSGAPPSAQSYAVILHDPDAPTGVGFFHWSVFNLSKETTSLAPGASASGLPAGAVQGYTDFGTNAYGGPCPPPGAPHRYIATVYALDVPKLDAGPSATGALLRFILGQHAVALGRATATYGRSP